MDWEIYGLSGVAVIIGLVELAKQLGFNPKYGGILAVGIGIVLSVCYTVFQEVDVFKAVVFGIVLGLTASGLYSTQKNARE